MQNAILNLVGIAEGIVAVVTILFFASSLALVAAFLLCPYRARTLNLCVRDLVNVKTRKPIPLCRLRTASVAIPLL
jgi:hypothetical protein